MFIEINLFYFNVYYMNSLFSVSDCATYLLKSVYVQAQISLMFTGYGYTFVSRSWCQDPTFKCKAWS